MRYLGDNEQVDNCPRAPFLTFTGKRQTFECPCPIYNCVPKLVRDTRTQGAVTTLVMSYLGCAPARPVPVTIDGEHACEHGEACQKAARQHVIAHAEACREALARGEINYIPEYLLQIVAENAVKGL